MQAAIGAFDSASWLKRPQRGDAFWRSPRSVGSLRPCAI